MKKLIAILLIITAFAVGCKKTGPVVADFSKQEMGPAQINTLTTFINNSSGDYTDVLWEFGDGFTSTDKRKEIKHIYTAAVERKVTLTVSNRDYSDQKTITIDIIN